MSVSLCPRALSDATSPAFSTDRQWNFEGTIDGTTVFLGCIDYDPHVPRDRLEESARELARIGGAVDLQIYPGLGHTINRDELSCVQRIVHLIERSG